MAIYQRREQTLPDDAFEPGELSHLVAGNEGRLLDPRRTPVTIVGLREATGEMVVRLEDFEDAGAEWIVPFEQVDRYQFARGSSRAAPVELARFQAAVDRLDRPMTITADPDTRRRTEHRIEHATADAARWLEEHSDFLAARRSLPAPETRQGDPALGRDLTHAMRQRGLDDIESGFATQFVRNPASGELVKGHRIVIAELGLVDYEGTVVRDPALFDGAWSRERRADHVITRLGFLRALFARLGVKTVTLHRGLSTPGPVEPPRNRTFISATFSRAVATSHYDAAHPGAGEPTRLLLTQPVPIERLFMTYHETAQMNEHYLEAEAVLFHDPAGRVF